MKINRQQLTPMQEELVLALLREEVLTNRLGDAFRAKTILAKIGEEVK